MELGLTIAAIIGILLFVIAYLRFVISGFKHHPVTGIIALFPVLNILVVPSLWYKNGRFLIVGFVGLLLAAGAWTMGAEKGFYKYVDLLLGKGQTTLVSDAQVIPATPVVTSSPLSIPNAKLTTQSTSSAVASSQVIATMPPIQRSVIDERNLESLPKKALYKMVFDTVPVNEIGNLKGRVVKVLDKNLSLYEGRIVNVNPSSVNLQLTRGSAIIELPIANIKKLRLMVKKPF